jgi:uncharacterized protein (TIGR02145 family)
VIKSFTTSPNVTDVDGNVYRTVAIGTQTWSLENLKTTKYNDGTAIPLITDYTTWGNLTTPGYCWYSNDEATSKAIYGALYNWYAVKTGKLAPAGWHIPTDAEWDTLQNYLIANGYNYDGTTTGNKIGKSMASQTNWSTFSTAGTVGCNVSINNSSHFSALPVGFRQINGYFYSVGEYGYWWSASESSASNAYLRNLMYYDNFLSRSNDSKNTGYSIRLVKD